MIMIEKMKSLFWTKKTELQIWFDSLQLSSLDFIRYASSFGVGFLIGLLFKRWSKYIVLVSIALMFALAILQGFSIITINMNVISRMIGMQGATTIQNCFLIMVCAIKKYALELSCCSIGFIIGFKTG